MKKISKPHAALGAIASLIVVVATANSFSTTPQSNDTTVHIENHSFARPDQAEVKHLELDLAVDFKKK